MYALIIIWKVWLLIAMWDAGLAFKLCFSRIVLQMNKNTGIKMEELLLSNHNSLGRLP